MKKLYAALLLPLFCLPSYAQTTLVAGPGGGSLYLVPFTSACLNTAVQNVSVCSGGVIGSFQFTSTQCCACPTSGKICLPGSVAYGGSGTSASFTYYHTLSYSPSNEHQQFYFSGPINTFQFSVAGPAGSSETFQCQTYNGGTLLSTHTFATGGTGVKNTYTITGAAFTRVQFTEISAISADDELFGDVWINSTSCAPLPFEITRFDATPNADQTVSLTWVTLDEVDNDRFFVERSADGEYWSEVLTQPGAGTTTGTREYAGMDIAPNAGINYYRLRTLDSQGTSRYSQIIKVNLNQSGNDVLVFPNPAGSWLSFNFGSIQGNMHISFINESGRTVKSIQATEALSAVEIAELPAGLYAVRILLPDGTSVVRTIMKQ